MVRGVKRVLQWWTSAVVAWLLRRVFLAPPPTVLFEALWREAAGGASAIKYELLYPRAEFLRWLAEREDVLFRGMPGPPLEVLQPTANTDAQQREVQAVFASGDPLWSLFFATLQLRGVEVPVSLRNGSVVAGHGARPPRCYWFSLNPEFAASQPWTDGTVYILPRDGFRPVAKGWLRFDEWLHDGEVRTLAVSRADFPFAHRVATHDRREPMWRTLLLYRWRVCGRRP